MARGFPLFGSAALAVLAVLLPSCSDAGDATEPPIARLLSFSACAQTSEFITILPDSSGAMVLHSGGTVTEVRSDPGVFESCPVSGRFMIGDRPSDSEALSRTTWLRFQTLQQTDVVLSFGAPGFVPRIQPGDTVQIDARSDSRPFPVGRSWFELRGGELELRFWFGEASSVAELKVPDELRLSEGEVQVRAGGDFLPSWLQLQLNAEASGTSASIGWNGQQPVGDWLVSNGGVSVQTSPSRRPDAFMTWASAALWPLADSEVAAPQ